jgi:cobalt-precorrin 5A hydrolase/precorrin-3B C17-methyltransferase
MSGPAIVVLGGRSAALARRIRAALADGEIHAPSCAACAADVRFDKATAHIASLFRAGRPILGVCAAGILIRAVAPHLADKAGEPPVVAVAEDASCVVPLLGGHRGANRLATRVAAALGATRAITTAGDLGLGIALDEPPPGWRLAPGGDVKAVTARLLEAEAARIEVEAGGDQWLASAQIARSPDARIALIATHRALPAAPATLVYHPPVLALGVGCERGAPAAELSALARAALAEAGLSPHAVACIVSLALKAAEPAIHALAEELGRPARFIDAATAAAQAERLPSPSPVVEAAVGVPGVAEAAALAAAGPDGRLLVPKRKSARCTVAVALAPTPIDPSAVGRPRGRLTVVGIGPGDPGGRTAAVVERLRRAEHLVGYQLYLDLVSDIAATATRHPFPLGAEAERCRLALDLAGRGAEVALVCSGDPGVYAMAALVVELLEGESGAGWEQIALEVLPGVSAFQAAAARVGAAVGHDFCAVSLSDLMTPWPVIERRLRAAAEGDFVVALYNPVSARRRSALSAARDILLAARAPDTPVVLARSLGRPGESVTIGRLDALDPAEVDMLTVVLVGSRASRRVMRRDGTELVLTPRGYAVG